MATKKTATNKSAAKKSARKAPAKKAGSDGTSAEDSPSRTAKKSPARSSRGSAPRAAAQKKPKGPAIAGEAARQLVELTGRDVEGVTGLSRTDDGWSVEVEVLEVRRIPETTDVLALYEITVDEDGDLEGYRRLRRYVRGTPGEESRR
jgi:Gas vesicle synthesis protein GvpO